MAVALAGDAEHLVTLSYSFLSFLELCQGAGMDLYMTVPAPEADLPGNLSSITIDVANK